MKVGLVCIAKLEYYYIEELQLTNLKYMEQNLIVLMIDYIKQLMNFF